MSTFLENIAPGLGSFTGGYLKGAAATQERYRQEELTRGKEALATYMKLLESGDWEAVDPEKGARTPGVLSIGNVGFLQPRKVSAHDEAKYELEREKMAHEKYKMTQEVEEYALKRGESALGREHEIKKRGLELQELEARLKAAKEKDIAKGEKETRQSYTNMTNGITTELTDVEYNHIMTAHPSKLSREELAIREAGEKGSLVKGKPSALSVKPPSELQLDRYSLDTQKRREQLMKDAGEPKVSDAGGNEIASQLNYLQPDNASMYYVWRPHWEPYRSGGKLVNFELPMGKGVDGAPMKLTMSHVRKKAKETGRSIDDVLNAIRQAMGKK